MRLDPTGKSRQTGTFATRDTARPRNRGGFSISTTGEIEMLGEQQATQKHAAGQIYAQGGAAIGPSTAPREIGLMPRMDGIVGSLAQLQDKTETLIGRLAGQPTGKDAGQTPQMGGLPGLMSSAEDRLRRLHQLVDGLNDAF